MAFTKSAQNVPMSTLPSSDEACSRKCSIRAKPAAASSSAWSETRRASGSARRRCRPQVDPAHPLEDVRDDQRVAERLAHLLAGRGDPPVVQRVRREAEPGRARLCLLVLVVREPQVDAATVDVEGTAEVLQRHGGALDVPPRAPGSPGRGPGRGLRLGRLLPALPEREVTGVALATRVGVLRGLHVVDALVRQLAVGRPRPHVEVHVPGAVLGRVGVTLGDQPGDQLDHLRDVTRGGRLVGRRLDVEAA